MGIRTFALVSLLLFLGGCSSMGSSKFGCGAPDGSRCASLPDVYAATDGAGVTRTALASDESDEAKRGDDDTGAALIDESIQQLRSISEQRPTPSPSQPSLIPLRTQARVMRVWVAPYEDARGDLHAGSRVYMEIEPKRWAVGDVGYSVRAIPSRLQVQDGATREPDANGAAARPGGLVEGTSGTTRNRAVGRR